jgi:hypothetical protein
MFPEIYDQRVRWNPEIETNRQSVLALLQAGRGPGPRRSTGVLDESVAGSG